MVTHCAGTLQLRTALPIAATDNVVDQAKGECHGTYPLDLPTYPFVTFDFVWALLFCLPE